MISTGFISLAFNLVISPKCSISGKCLFDIDIAFLSISLAHTVFIPTFLAAKGNTPIPSNKLPSVISFTLHHLFSIFIISYIYFIFLSVLLLFIMNKSWRASSFFFHWIISPLFFQFIFLFFRLSHFLIFLYKV